jgi:hypothetical protein
MNVGDLVRFRNKRMQVGKTFLITWVSSVGMHVSLLGFPENQVFSPSTLELVVDESR